LFARGRTESVAGCQQHALALSGKPLGEALPMDVVLPAPLTPATITTSGWPLSKSKRPSAGASSAASSSRNANRHFVLRLQAGELDPLSQRPDEAG